ncbi:MAG: carbohydrate kinase [Melioribacteraceae bacterium]
MAQKILCIGEILWDSLPNGLFLGGAPFNVACHLHRLKCDVSVVTRVGNDVLGRIINNRVNEKGISTDHFQVDNLFSTGLVNVTLDKEGNAFYEIVAPAAWDYIEADDLLMKTAEKADIIVFGSLAQRNKKSKETIQKILDLNKINIFDVNLRPPYDNHDIISDTLYKTKICKLNDLEILKLAEWYGFESDLHEAAIGIREKFGCEIVCVTRGSHGASLLRNNEWVEDPGFKVTVRDTVGAGDSFLAALIKGFLQDKSNEELLEDANLLGAYVVTKDGPTPILNFDRIEKIRKERKEKK